MAISTTPKFTSSSDDTGSTTPVVEPEFDFSYERDIAPMQQRFFRSVYSDRSIDPRDRAAIASGFASQLGSAFAEQSKLRDIDQQARNRDLAYRTSLFSLEQARERASRERSMLESLPKVTSELDAMTADPTADPEAQKSMLSRWAISNAGVLATNDAARIAYDAAIRGLRKPTPVGLTDEDVVRMGLPLDKLDVNKDGIVSDEERTPVKVSGLLTEATTAQSLLKQEKERGEKRTRMVDEALKGLSRVSFATEKSDIPGTADIVKDEFASAGNSAAVDSVISLLAPSIAAEALKQSPMKKFEIARELQNQYLSASSGSPRPTGPRSRFVE